MKKTPGWGSQSSLSQSPREVGGGAWAGPQIFIVLISSFLQPGPWAAELGTLAEQSHGQSVTCVGSGAPSGWGLGERVQHTLAVQLACFLAIPLWEMGRAVASAGSWPILPGPRAHQRKALGDEAGAQGSWTGSRERWSGMGEEGICCFLLSQDQLRRDGG